MVAVLLAIGLTGVAGMFTAGLISNHKSANMTLAADRTEQEVERLRNAGYLGAVVDLAHFPASRYTIVSATQVSFTVAELKDGAGNIYLTADPEAAVIDPATGAPIGNLAHARVVITWGGARSVRGSYSVSTLLANRP